MNVKWTAILCWCACESVALAAFTPDEARRVYGESSSASNSVCTEVGDYVFMELKWKTEADASAEDRDAQEMSALMDALESYVAPKQTAVTNSPFCRELTEWLVPETAFKIPDVASVTLKDEEAAGERRMVVAFDATALHEARDSAKSRNVDMNGYSPVQWTEALSAAYANFKTRDEKRKFFFLLGCPVVSLLDREIGLNATDLTGRSDRGSVELDRLLKWKPTQGSVYCEHPALTWSFYRQSDSDFFFPAWSETDGGAFAKAEKLYLHGKDIPKIISLLAESITKNPIGARKWEYLGGVLKASNRHQDAVVAYLQALRQKNDSAWAWKGLMGSMKKTGMEVNATGLEWYLRMKGIVQ